MNKVGHDHGEFLCRDVRREKKGKREASGVQCLLAPLHVLFFCFFLVHVCVCVWGWEENDLNVICYCLV